MSIIKKICCFLIIFIMLTLIKNNNSYKINYYDNKLNNLKDYYNNNDIVGLIKIDDTNINNVIVKGTDNEYYLSHSISKKEDEKGSIFLDYRVNLNSKQINIYGHNSLVYELPFKELENYLNKDFYEKHKYITIWDGNKEINYIIFSIKITTNNEHMNLNITDNHINYLNDSLYNTGIYATVNDNILILQTCNYTEKDSYILIIAKRFNSTI